YLIWTFWDSPRDRHGAHAISTASTSGVVPALQLPSLPALKLPRPSVGWYARLRAVPFILLHVAALVTPFLVPVTWPAVGLCVLFYAVRMSGTTAFSHRSSAHRA